LENSKSRAFACVFSAAKSKKSKNFKRAWDSEMKFAEKQTPEHCFKFYASELLKKEITQQKQFLDRD